MEVRELAIWSMALGAIALLALVRLTDLLTRPSLSQWQALAYHCTVFLLVLILSGVATHLWPTLDARLIQIAQVLAGPVCVGLSNFWIRGWLKAAQRDRLMSGVLRTCAIALPVAALACLGLPREQQIPAAAALALGAGTLTLWLTTRAWQLGDPLAAVMALGCLLTLPAIAGLHAIALDLPGMGLAGHAAVAACAALSNALTGLVLWRRDRQEWRARSDAARVARLDPITNLHSGSALVRKLIKAQQRRQRTRREGALLAVMVFDLEPIAAQVGTCGLNEMFICLASRISRQVGVVNPVGRYYDRCFICLVETIGSPAWLRTLGLRVASHLRRPMVVKAASGELTEITVDVGVGLVHLGPGPAAVEDILHEAQHMAQAARAMRSRAAILDSRTGESVPVELARLAPRQPGHGKRAQQAA